MSQSNKLATQETASLRPTWIWFVIGGLWLVFTSVLYLGYSTDPMSFGLLVFENYIQSVMNAQTYILDLGYGFSAFDVYYQGAISLTEGQSLYAGTTGWIYLYPPLTAQVLIPVVYLADYDVAAFLWLIVNIVALAGVVKVLSAYVPKPMRRWMWVLPLVFVPIGQAIYIGQVTVIMLALLTWTWVAVQRGNRGLAGALLALACWIKVFPALLVVYFLWKRDWRVIRGVIIAGFGLAGLQILISGPELFFEFFGVLFQLTTGGQPEATYENNSIFAFASRLFQENIRVYPLVVNETLYTLTRVGLLLIVFGAAGIAIWRSGAKTTVETPSWRFDIEYALVLLTILLFGSTLWISGMPPLLLIFVLIWRHQAMFRNQRLIRWMLGFSFAAICLYIPMMAVFMADGQRMHALPLSLGFFGVMALWALLVMLLFEKPETESVPA